MVMVCRDNEDEVEASLKPVLAVGSWRGKELWLDPLICNNTEAYFKDVLGYPLKGQHRRKNQSRIVGQQSVKLPNENHRELIGKDLSAAFERNIPKDHFVIRPISWTKESVRHLVP
jgi:hypothetical protein